MTPDLNTTSDVTVTRPLDGVVHLDHADPGARRAGLSTNTYALLNEEGEALLVDASFDYLLPPLRTALEGTTPVGLALTHRHLIDSDSVGVRHIADAFGIPVLLHPRDVSTARRGAAQVPPEDPTGGDLLAAFGLETILFPGHTEGSVMYYRASDGLLLTGDAAVGPTRKHAADGIERFTRPAIMMNTDDAGLRRGWAAFDRPVRHVLPFHGAIAVDLDPEETTRFLRPLQREAPTRDMAGNT